MYSVQRRKLYLPKLHPDTFFPFCSLFPTIIQFSNLMRHQTYKKKSFKLSGKKQEEILIFYDKKAKRNGACLSVSTMPLSPVPLPASH